VLAERTPTTEDIPTRRQITGLCGSCLASWFRLGMAGLDHL